MKLKVFGQKEEKEEEVVYLRLIATEDVVDLIACSRTGERLSQGDLLRITGDGTIIRCKSINPNLGFKLDKHRQLKIEK